MLFHSLFGTELLGFSSPQWDLMEGTVPSANKHKFQMACDQLVGTVWSRKYITTDVESLYYSGAN